MKKVKVQDLWGSTLAWAMHVLRMMDDGLSREEAEEDANTCQPGLGAFDLEELIEIYRIGLLPPDGHRGSQWMAFFYQRTQYDLTMAEGIQDAQFGGTPINAVLRCILAHHVGKEVEVPEGLL